MTPGNAQPGVVLVGGMRSHQENYAAALKANGCRLLAVGVAGGLDADETSRHAELAASLGLPLLPLHQALTLPDATIASIAVSMAHRARVAATCAEAGLHLYLDKPLAGSAADAAAIAASVRTSGVAAHVFSHVATLWARAARDAIHDGRIGRVIAMHADMLMAKGVPSPISSARRQEAAQPTDYPEDIAKRELTDMGFYPLSLVTWLLGRRAESVEAITANHFFAEHLSRDVEDYGAMLIEFEGGSTASITCGRTGWHSWPRPFLSRIVIVGETDTLVFDSDPMELTITSAGGARPIPNPDDPMEMWLSTRRGVRPRPALSTMALAEDGYRDVAAFLARIGGGTDDGIGIDDAAHHCEILAAAYRSAAENRRVAVTGGYSPSGSR